MALGPGVRRNPSGGASRIWRMRSTTGSLMRAGGCVRARERLCSTWGSSGSASCNRFFHCLTHPSDMPTAWAYCCCEKSRVQSHQPTQIGSRCIVYYFHNGTSWLYRLNICQQCTVPAPRFARLRCYYTLSVTRLLPHTDQRSEGSVRPSPQTLRSAQGDKSRAAARVIQRSEGSAQRRVASQGGGKPRAGQAPPLPYTGSRAMQRLGACYLYLFDGWDYFWGQS